MTAVFHGISYGIFIDIKSNLRRKKPHRMNKVPIFFEAVLAIKTMKEPQSKFEEKTILDLFIFTSIAPKLLDQPNKTICHFLSQYKMSALGQIQVQKPTLALTTSHMTNDTE